MEASGSAGYSDGVTLCLAAGNFMANCLTHLHIKLASQAPDASATDPADWAAISTAAMQMEMVWAQRDAIYGIAAVGHLWSLAVAL